MSGGTTGAAGATTPLVIGELLEERAGRLGSTVFLRFRDDVYTYEQMDRYANRCANAFRALGVQKADKVSIMLPNCPEFLHLWFGLAKIGAVEVPVNTSYKGEFLRHIVDQSDSVALVIDEEYLPRLQLIQDQLGKLRTVIVRGAVAFEQRAALRIPLVTYKEFFAAPEARPEADVRPPDDLSIIYTSGTTGLSKGALGSHKFWVVCAEQMLDYRDGGKDDVFYTFLPLYHFNAQVLTVLTTLVAEASMVLSDKFSASRFWDDIRRYGATQFNYLGAVIPILAKQPPRPDDLDNPAKIALGAGCPPGVMR